MDFGNKLRTLRINANKSQAAVSREITARFPEFSLSQAYLSALENRPAAPRQEVLTVLAEYFDVPVTHFLNDTKASASYGLLVADAWLEAIRHGRAPVWDSDDEAITHAIHVLAANSSDDEW